MSEIFDLHGKVALVTGASSGLGLRFAECVAENGAAVVLVARRADRLKTLADEIVAAGGAAPIIIPCDLEARDAADEIPGAVEPHAPWRAGLGLPGQRRHDLRLGLGADARHVAQAAGRGRLPQLASGADVERAGDVDRALGAQPEVAAEADEVRHKVALELGELRDLSRRHELAQAGLDPGADPPQLATATGGDELGDRHPAVADALGCPPVGADRVRIGVAELQHRREGVEPVGDLGVVHYVAAALSTRSRSPDVGARPGVC